MTTTTDNIMSDKATSLSELSEDKGDTMTSQEPKAEPKFADDAPSPPTINQFSDLDEEELDSYILPRPRAAAISPPDLRMSPEQLLRATILSLCPTLFVQTWAGGPWLAAPDSALRGASLYSIIYRPELYMILEDADEEDGEPIDPIRTEFKIQTAKQREEEIAAKEADTEAAKFAEEEETSQEQLMEWSQGRQSRSRTAAKRETTAEIEKQPPKKPTKKRVRKTDENDEEYLPVKKKTRNRMRKNEDKGAAATKRSRK